MDFIVIVVRFVWKMSYFSTERTSEQLFKEDFCDYSIFLQVTGLAKKSTQNLGCFAQVNCEKLFYTVFKHVCFVFKL